VFDLQTADTRELEPISNRETSESETLQLPVPDEDAPAEASKFDDEGVLDLGDIDSFTAAAPSEEDFVLDVEIEPVTLSSAPIAPVTKPTVSESVRPAVAESGDVQETAFEEAHESALTRVTDETSDEVSVAPHSGQPQTSGLSPDEIEAISRRVVEQLSDKVVREIAWEVVPELSELLIKRRLEEQR
jgi:hypothetical protein